MQRSVGCQSWHDPRSPASQMGRQFVNSANSNATGQPGGHAENGSLRGLVPERVVITTELDPFLPLRSLAAYAGLSVRPLRQYLDLPPDHALPCYRVGGKILVRRSEFDAWVAQYQSRGRPELARALKELGLDKEDV